MSGVSAEQVLSVEERLNECVLGQEAATKINLQGIGKLRRRLQKS
jgi:hypothetical protein